MSCIVSSCGKSRFTCKDDTHFHCFPKDPELSEKWRIALRRSRRHAPITKSSLVCSLHFKSSDYSSLPNVNGFKARIKLKSTAVPSIFPPRDKIKKSQLLKHAARLQAAKAEKMKTEADADPGNPTGKGKQRFYIMVPKHKIVHSTGAGFLLPGTTVKVQLPEGGGQLLTMHKNSSPASATQTRSPTPQENVTAAFETVFLNSANLANDHESSHCEADLIATGKCDFEPDTARQTTPNIKQEKIDEEFMQQESLCESEIDTKMTEPSNSVANKEHVKENEVVASTEKPTDADMDSCNSDPSCSTEEIQIKEEAEDEAHLNFTESPNDFNFCGLEPICSIDEQDTEFHIKEEPEDQNSFGEYSNCPEPSEQAGCSPMDGDMKHKHEIYAGLAKTLGQNKFNSKVLARMDLPSNHRRKQTFQCRFCPDTHRALIRCKSDHVRLLCCRCLSSTNYRTPGALKTHLRNVHHLTKCQVEVNTYILIMQRLPPVKITLRCAFCEQAQSSVRSLGTHLKHRHGYCRYCGPVKSEGIDAVDHIDKHHAAFRNLFKCSICKAIYVTKAQMFQHYSTEHQGSEVIFCTLDMDITKQHCCPYCYFCTDVYEILEFHMFLHTLKCCYNCNDVYLLPAKSVQNSEFKYCTTCDVGLHYPSITALPCLFCDTRYAPGVSLYEHQRVKHHCCGVCKLTFSSLADLTEHEGVYHMLIYDCLHCPLKFLSGNDINIHRLKLHNKVKYCGIQGQSSVTYSINQDRNKFQYEKILTQSHCGYCCEYLPHSFEFEEHLELKHNVKRCTTCLRLVVDVCANCVQENEQACPENNCMLVYDT